MVHEKTNALHLNPDGSHRNEVLSSFLNQLLEMRNQANICRSILPDIAKTKHLQQAICGKQLSTKASIRRSLRKLTGKPTAHPEAIINMYNIFVILQSYTELVELCDRLLLQFDLIEQLTKETQEKIHLPKQNNLIAILKSCAQCRLILIGIQDQKNRVRNPLFRSPCSKSEYLGRLYRPTFYDNQTQDGENNEDYTPLDPDRSQSVSPSLLSTDDSSHSFITTTADKQTSTSDLHRHTNSTTIFHPNLITPKATNPNSLTTKAEPSTSVPDTVAVKCSTRTLVGLFENKIQSNTPSPKKLKKEPNESEKSTSACEVSAENSISAAQS